MNFFGTATAPLGGSHVHSQSTAFLGGLSISPGAEPNDAQPTRTRNRVASTSPQPANDAGNRTDLEGVSAGVINNLGAMAKPPRNGNWTDSRPTSSWTALVHL